MNLEPNEQEIEASEHILGAMMVDPAIIPDVIGVLGQTPDAFFKTDFKLIYQAIIACHNKEGKVNSVIVATELDKHGDLNRAGGTDYLYDLQARIAETDNTVHYAGIIQERWIRRQISSTCHELMNSVSDGEKEPAVLLNEAQEKFFSIEQNQNINAIVPFPSAVTEVIAEIEALSKNEKAYTGISTGFQEFDVLTSGLQPKDLIIIAARPSMGKTTLVLNIATFVAIDLKIPVGIFSLEMPQNQIIKRILAADSRIDFSKIYNGNLDDKDWETLTESADLIRRAPFHVDDTRGMTVQTLRAKVRQLKTKEEQLGLIIVDYLQLLRTEGTHRRNMGMVEEISEISRELKTLAWEMDVPVIACSQLNRDVERRNDKRPILADLRESGAIEQDADLVAFLYREDYYDEQADDQGTAELLIKKQRNGPTGTVKLQFVKEQMRFETLQSWT